MSLNSASLLEENSLSHVAETRVKQRNNRPTVCDKVEGSCNSIIKIESDSDSDIGYCEEVPPYFDHKPEYIDIEEMLGGMSCNPASLRKENPVTNEPETSLKQENNTGLDSSNNAIKKENNSGTDIGYCEEVPTCFENKSEYIGIEEMIAEEFQFHFLLDVRNNEKVDKKADFLSDKQFNCKYCGKSMSRLDHLRRHETMHTGQKAFKCNVCGNSFKRLDHLKRHEIMHSGQKPFKCSVCEKSFTRVDHYKSHVKTHTDQKPIYKCKFCEKTFSRQDTLKSHEKLHTGRKLFVCNICGKPFTRSSSLKTHAVTHIVPVNC